MKAKTVISWLAQALAALILLQTLYFKFTAHPESVYIFSTLGLEPAGRIGIGVGELITAILLLIPATAWLGAILGMGLMSGALFFHFTKLGLEVRGDGGYLFVLALIVFACCALVLWLRRRQIPLHHLPFRLSR